MSEVLVFETQQRFSVTNLDGAQFELVAFRVIISGETNILNHAGLDHPVVHIEHRRHSHGYWS